ncbi:hypothetical protein DSBG_0087 [Desulfosporosinus sp. BG]|nr:hypothetical protein DSBG_0087 [Desulfosporosinus sp. BG]
MPWLSLNKSKDSATPTKGAVPNKALVLADPSSLMARINSTILSP